VRQRVARSRELVAEGHAASVVARVAKISRQALYRVPRPRSAPRRHSPADPVEAAIVAEALANQTDGYRMICAFVRRRLGIAVNRKRVLRVMRERKLIQRRRPLERRKRPGFFWVERPRQLWQLDLTSVWVAEHGWTGETPLWIYVLKEAEALNDGDRLGPVGGRIVGEVLVGIIDADHESLRSVDRSWTPTLPSHEPGRFGIADILVAAPG